MLAKRKILALALCALLLGMPVLPVMAETATPDPAPTEEAAPAETATDAAEAAPAATTVRWSRMAPRAMTEEQKQAAQQANADRDAAYEAYLAKLAAAAILAQAELDAYHLMANYKEIASSIDTMQWTLAKNIELRNALAKNGAELRGAIAGFVADGLLTELEGDALVAVNTSSRDIDYDNLTIGQYKAMQKAMAGTSEERAAMLQDLVAQGLLTQIEADVLLSAKVSAVERISARLLTEEQRAAWKTAKEELRADYAAIADQLSKALTASGN